jgi:hypothetical protein
VAEAAEISEDLSAPEKCTRLLVLNVVRNVKFLSNQQKASQFTAEIVTRRKEDSNFIRVI